MGNRAHAEGGYGVANGVDAHSEGRLTVAFGEASHAEGYNGTHKPIATTIIRPDSTKPKIYKFIETDTKTLTTISKADNVIIASEELGITDTVKTINTTDQTIEVTSQDFGDKAEVRVLYNCTVAQGRGSHAEGK